MYVKETSMTTAQKALYKMNPTVFKVEVGAGSTTSVNNGSAVVNEYELDDCWRDEHKVKVFEAYDEEWLDFVVANRNGDDVECFDAVEGGIADDKVFETVDLYLEGLINKNEALNRLVFEKPNHQICFLNQKVIDDNLKFVKGTKI